MLLDTLTVEVRNEALTRVGVIPDKDLDLTIIWGHNTPGSWELSLAPDHPLSEELRQPGAGIVASINGETRFSGPVTKPEVVYTSEDSAGTITYRGVSDSIILDDFLCFPQPSNSNPQTQNADKHTLTGKAETIMHGFVKANIGPTGSAGRRHPFLTMGHDEARGVTTKFSARFTQLRDTVGRIALANDLGFQVMQRDDSLVFETYAIVDRSNEIRLSLSNGTLSSSKVSYAVPALTRAIVGGKGSGKTRLMREYMTPESEEAESRWGRRIERYINQDSTTDLDELKTAGMDALKKEGFTLVAAQSVPVEGTSMEFGVDWYVGDIVTIECGPQEFSALVSGAALKASSEGVYLGITIGDPLAFDPFARAASALTDLNYAYDRTTLYSEFPSEAFETLIADVAALEGGGGGTDGGDMGDGFTDPTFDSWSPDGPPTHYVDYGTNRLHTPDEAWSFANTYVFDVSADAGTIVWERPWFEEEYEKFLYPAWVAPAGVQSSYLSVDSIAIEGVETRFSPEAAPLPYLSDTETATVYMGDTQLRPGVLYHSAEDYLRSTVSSAEDSGGALTIWNERGSGTYPVTGTHIQPTIATRIIVSLHLPSWGTVPPTSPNPGYPESNLHTITITGIQIDREV